MLRLTKELQRATAQRERALLRLRKKTLRAALHLQTLLKDEGAVGNAPGREYRVIHVTWEVEHASAGSKAHPKGADVLGVRAGPQETWTTLYDPRQPGRDIDTQTIWEVKADAPLFVDSIVTGSEVALPSAETMMTFAKDYPALVKKRTTQAKESLALLETAIKELDDATSSK